jgi:hypothetical protein
MKMNEIKIYVANSKDNSESNMQRGFDLARKRISKRKIGKNRFVEIKFLGLETYRSNIQVAWNKEI